MREKTKRKKKITKNERKKREAEEKESVSGDQKEKSYYYDDAHGYKIYVPEEDELKDSPDAIKNGIID